MEKMDVIAKEVVTSIDRIILSADSYIEWITMVEDSIKLYDVKTEELDPHLSRRLQI